MNNHPSRTIPCAHVIGTARALVGPQAITIAGATFASIEPTAAPTTERLLAMPAL